MDDSYPRRWAEVFSVRLTYGDDKAVGAWHRFRSCLKDGPYLAALQKGLPPSLLSELLAAAASPEADPRTMWRLARLLDEWVQSEAARVHAATRTSDT